MNKLMKQAAEMQKQLAEAQEAASNEIVEGSAGGMVVVKATGEGKLVELNIDPKAIDPDDPEMLEDLVLAAVNNALENADALMKSKMGGLMGGLGMPGM
jgi:nucleoid-associated protein EbfC